MDTNTSNTLDELDIKNIVIDNIRDYNVKREIIIHDIHKEKFINRYVEHIYILNLSDDSIRRNYIKVLMEKYQINYELIIVDRIKKPDYDKVKKNFLRIGEYGCYLSHLFCFNDAIQNNYNNIIIFEDDIVLHKQFHLLFENIMNNQKYNMLMLGAADFHFIKNQNLVDKSKCVYIPSLDSKYLYGTHAIYYSKEAIQRMFNFKINNIYHMDFNLISILKDTPDFLHVCFPNLVIVELSTTNIEHSFWIGNRPTTDSYYYRKCFNFEINLLDYNLLYLELLKNFTFDSNIKFSDNIFNAIDKKITDEKINKIIKERIVLDFFTNDDLFKIIK